MQAGVTLGARGWWSTSREIGGTTNPHELTSLFVFSEELDSKVKYEDVPRLQSTPEEIIRAGKKVRKTSTEIAAEINAAGHWNKWGRLWTAHRVGMVWSEMGKK